MDRLNVAILIFDDVEVLDFAGPYEVFSRTRLSPGVESRRDEESAPFSVFTVAKTERCIVATGGLKVTPDHDFVSAPAIDVLVVPGGFGTRPLLEDAETIEWIVEQSKVVKQMTSVCTGALLLAHAGLLKGRDATTHWGAYDVLAQIDETISVKRGERVVVDGVITSGGVSSGIDMAFDLVETLHGQAVADDTAKYIEYHRSSSNRAGDG